MSDFQTTLSAADDEVGQPGDTFAHHHHASARKKRCHTGCTICRVRKVKCDERPGGCSNCERLQLKCPGAAQEILPPVEELRLPPKAGIKRKKTYRSCTECRASKTRCSGDRPVCQRCVRKQIDCVYDADPDPAWTKNMATPLAPRQNHVLPQLHAQEDIKPVLDNVSLMSEPYDMAGVTPTSPHVGQHLDSVDWLYAAELPNADKLRFLLDQYFNNIHPLRCFGFLHRPSFMQKFNESLSSSPTANALLYTVCALGAKFALLPLASRLPPQQVLTAGDKWSREASRLIFADLDTISVENLMAAVLLHDHELRVGRFASAFMLSGVSARWAQALQVNLEYSADIICTDPGNGPSPTAREARRRLMWSCYVMDAWVGSGVDQLTLFDNDDIKIQLPVCERLFLEQKPAVTETLEPGRTLRCIPPASIDTNPADHIGMAAYFVRLTYYRKQVLRYVKHLDTAQAPWLPESEFSYLDGCLRHWYKTLPLSLQFNPTTQYTRLEGSQLGALVLLHCAFHQTNVDLYRIGTPRLFKIRENIHFPPERLGFLTSIRQTCYHHASQIARILQIAGRYGVHTLADTWLAIVAHDANRVMLYYLTNFLDANSPTSGAVYADTLALIFSNLNILKLMTPLFSMSSSLYEAAATLVRHSGVDGHPQLQHPTLPVNHAEPSDGTEQRPTAPNTPIQSTPEYVLNPLAIYRLARRAVPEKEKHQPELHPNPELGDLSSQQLEPPSDQPPLAPTSTSTGWYVAGPAQPYVGGDAAPTTLPGHPAGAAPQPSPAVQMPSNPSIPLFATALPNRHVSVDSDGAPTSARGQPSYTSDPTNSQHEPNNMAGLLRPPPKLNVSEDMFFSSALDTIWQPAETVLGSTGIAPWESDLNGIAGNNGVVPMKGAITFGAWHPGSSGTGTESNGSNGPSGNGGGGDIEMFFPAGVGAPWMMTPT